MKKTLLCLLLILSLSLTALVGCDLTPGKEKPEDSAAAIYTMDVNPGVRICVDTDGKVITVEATNDDGEALVADLTFEGLDFEAVTESIIDKLTEAGYITGDEGSLLLTLEKAEIEISERLNKKIDAAFEKHGKTVSVIEQRLDALDEKLERKIDEIADEHRISRGKAHLIEMIREEFPELSEEELASLNVNELRMLLEDTTDAIKDRFDKLGEIVESEYKSREEAVLTALASLDLDLTGIDGIPLIEVRATNRDGEMLYLVKIVLNGMKHELLISAESGEILKSESTEHEEFDPEAAIDEFLGKHGIDGESLRDYLYSVVGGIPEGTRPEHELTRGEILKLIIDELDLPEGDILSTDVKLHHGNGEAVFHVVIETRGGTYELVLEAFSGEVIKAEQNGESLVTGGEAE